MRVRCHWCGDSIAWLRLLRGRPFCSDEHQRMEQSRHEQMALDRLHWRAAPANRVAVSPAPPPRRSAKKKFSRKSLAWLTVCLLLPVIAGFARHTLSAARERTRWVVYHLPDPPGYQESLPNRPAAEEPDHPPAER